MTLTIVLMAGRAFIGEVQEVVDAGVPITRAGCMAPQRRITPPYELTGGLQGAALPNGRTELRARPSIGVFCGLLSLASIPVPPDAILIPLTDLSEEDRTSLENGVTQLADICANVMRAQRSGLVVAAG